MTEDELREHQRFALSMEQSIRMANREVLHPVVEAMARMAIRVAALMPRR